MIKHAFTTGLLATCLSITALIGQVAPAQADPVSVEYDGASQSFIFSPDSTDLFDGFKNLMPGDTIDQEITVSNSDSSYDVEIFIRAESIDPTYETMLSEMSLTVTQEGTSSLFEAPPSEQDDLADWVSLGTIEPGGQANLLATLSVPEDLGDEHQNAYGEVVWSFMVIEDTPDEDSSDGSSTESTEEITTYPTSSSTTQTSLTAQNSSLSSIPQTGDISLWIIGVLAATSLIAAALILIVRGINHHNGPSSKGR